MTTSLVARLSLDGDEPYHSLDDLLELLALHANKPDFQEVWVLVYCTRLTPFTQGRICEFLRIPNDRLLSVSKPLDSNRGARLLASAIAFLGTHQRVVLHDANTDTSFDEIVPQMAEKTLSNNNVYGNLHHLEGCHRHYRLSDMLASLDSLMVELARERSSPAVLLSKLLRPFTRFVRTLNFLILSPSPCSVPPKAGHYDSLSLVDFSAEVSRLSYLHGELDDRFAALEFVTRAANFFSYGSQVHSAIRTARNRAGRLGILPNVLAWWYAFNLYASRELSNLGHYSIALLHLVRAFESYALAYLGQRRFLMFSGMHQRLYLTNGAEPNFTTLKQALMSISPSSSTTQLDADLEDLRQCRNGNLLVHGYHIPDKHVIVRMRNSIKGIVSHLEKSLPPSGKLLRGVVGDFSSGERLHDDLGRIIAEAFLRSTQSSN